MAIIYYYNVADIVLGAVVQDSSKLKCDFWEILISHLGWGLKICISNKLPCDGA